MTTTLRARPEASEYASFYHGYVTSVPEGDVVALLRSTGGELLEAVGRIPEARGGHRYGPDKWTIREVIGHMIDAERIFTYRALRVARGDRTPLASFDENEFVKKANSEARKVADLTRKAWSRSGVASGKDVSLRALAYIVTGHAMHHLRILRERYGI